LQPRRLVEERVADGLPPAVVRARLVLRDLLIALQDVSAPQFFGLRGGHGHDAEGGERREREAGAGRHHSSIDAARISVRAARIWIASGRSAYIGSSG